MGSLKEKIDGLTPDQKRELWEILKGDSDLKETLAAFFGERIASLESALEDIKTRFPNAPIREKEESNGDWWEGF